MALSSASSDLPVPLGEIYGEICELCHENVELEAVRGVLEQFNEVCGRYVLNCTDSVGQTMLHYACNRGHLYMVRVLADKELKADLTIEDHYGDTALAAFKGHEDKISVLLSECGPSTKGRLSTSLLHIACKQGSIGLVRALIKEHEADTHARDNQTNSPLHIAASSGKEGVVSCLISEFGCDPNAKGHFGRSVLHIACQRGDISLVQTLACKHRADLNLQDNFHNTPLHVAILNGKLEVSLCLINELGCDPDVKGSLGRSVLHIACQFGKVSLVRALTKANVYALDGLGNTPLHIAVSRGEEKIVSCLINEFGCDPNVKGELGRSALHIACQKGDISLVRTLIRHKAAVKVQDDHNNMPLHVAALENNEKVVLCLIREFGCDPNERGQHFKSVLHIACGKGNLSLVQTLIPDHNADVNLRDEYNDTPLHRAVVCSREDIVMCLIQEFGCDPNEKGFQGRSLLHRACVGGSVSLVRTLILEHECDTNLKNDNNNTPLHFAAIFGKDKVALCLIDEFGCDPSVGGQLGRSLLHSACQGGSVNLVKILIQDHNADVNLKDDYSDTPLHVAALSGKEEVALCLISKFNCDPDVRGNSGRSLLHSACIGGSVSLVRTLILQHKADTNLQDDHNDTALHATACSGMKDIALCLINEFGCDHRVRGRFGRSVLHCACKGGNVSLVQTLIQDHNADVNLKDDYSDTPLHEAALSGKEEVALCLINEFGCDHSVRGQFGRSVLHCACKGGNVSLVQTLIQEHKADIICDHGADGNLRDYKNSTALNLAALGGKKELALYLMNNYSCDPTVRGQFGRSVLHDACAGGNVSLVQYLIQNQKLDINLRDDNNDTPLHVAAFNGKDEVASCLLKEFGCDPNVKGNVGRSVLHCACRGGNVSLVRTLILKHKTDVNALDDKRYTPLCLACCCGKSEIAMCLIEEFGCDPKVRGSRNRTLLHFACYGGSLQLVQTLIQKYNAGIDINSRDDSNDTPFHQAALSGRAEVLEYLIDRFGCDPNVKGDLGKSLLHCACCGNNLALVKTLIQDHQADINAKDDLNDTPLFNAAESGNSEVVLWMINSLECDLNTHGYLGKTLLHHACEGGNISVVRTLIQEYGFDVEAEDTNRVRPLQVAALFGKTGVALTLITEFGCDVHAKGYSNRSLLHDACEGGSVFLVQYLLSKLSVLSTDNDGNTPLHTCASHGQTLCVEALLSANAPPLIRNNTGQTPMDVAKGRARVVLEEYLLKNHRKLQFNYNAMLGLAKSRYSGEYPVTRLFVLGNPGAGKSTLVESFKTEGFLRSFWGEIPESSVTPHTPGIIPTVYLNKHYGRVLLYDFAGDPEYYSSHAAILENLVSSKSGNNLMIIVVDLRGDEEAIEEILHYWVAFVKFQRCATKLSLLIVGSHSDSIPLGQMGEKIGVLEKFAGANSLQAEAGYFTLDCRKPKNMTSLQNQITVLTSQSPQCSLSENASLLWGLLEKDFKNVTACSLQTVLSHIKEYRLGLPDQAEDLYLTLSELRDIGVLLLLGDRTKGNCHIVLNISMLTRDVHQSLFSKSAIEKLRKKFKGSRNKHSPNYNIGILPDSLLKEILPPYITKQCLSYLQYCQEIKLGDVGAFVLEPAQSESSFFFFPALCSLSKGDVSRVTPPNFSYSIGWLAQCTARDHYFPPRFLHVLLLRLVFRFTLSAPTLKHAPGTPFDDSHLKRRCSMWKTGVFWLMKEGVACQVELVNGSKGVVVITRSTEEKIENCISVFRKIICCVMESKAEFCAPIRPDFFLLDSTEEADYLTEDNFFAMHEVEGALTDPDGGEGILSVTGKKYMERSRLFFMRKLTHWDTFFPIDFVSVLRCVDKVEAKYLYNLGLELNMLSNTLDDILEDLPTNVGARRRKLVRAWLSSSLEPPCWWCLVQALKADGVESAYLTEKIVECFGKCNSYTTTTDLKWI